jgi:peptidoglycan hydrolase-like protein with peptidoglycan-binding domain
MKNLLLFACFLGNILGANAQTAITKPADQPTAFYSIQLGAFEESVKQADFEAIRSYAFVYKRDGLVYVGGFPTPEAAQPILEKVKAKGFDDAFVAEKSFKKAKSGFVVQIATKNASEPIDWQKYAEAGELYTVPSGIQVRVVQGFYEDKNDANVKLKEVQALGFADAFVRNVRDVQASRVTEFETGDKKLLAKAPVEAKSKTPEKKPTSYNAARRKSVMKLQEALKEMGMTTTSTPDGVFGRTTQAAYDKAIKQNRRLVNYNAWAEAHGDFGDWSAARLLMTMTRDLSVKDEQAAVVADLLNNLPEDPLSKKDADAALAWHSATWKKLEAWSTQAQYNDQVYTALKVAYYRTLTQLEDYYAAKGVAGEAATALSVSVIHTLIGEDLTAF